MFDDYFEVYLADNEEARRIHYHIRYRVYCEEMGFEKKENFSECYEIDAWDRESVHFIVKHRYSNEWVGAMRLVLKSRRPLPVETHCELHEGLVDYDWFRSVEVSRLCVIKEIRRRKTDGDPPAGLPTTANDAAFFSEKRMQRSIIWGLIRAGALYSRKHGIDMWYLLVTSALAKVIVREAFPLKLIGESCQLNGDRYPFRISVEQVLANPLWLKDYQVGYRLYSKSFEQGLCELAACA